MDTSFKIFFTSILLTIFFGFSAITLAAEEAESQEAEKAEKSKAEEASARKRSNVYLYRAGKARDRGEVPEALGLFKLAIQEDPTNARAHVLFGDYLTGYRGQFEAAYEHYRIAEDLLKAKGPLHKTEVGKRLERSMSIFHRDVGDGVEAVKTQHFALSFTSLFEYNRESVNSNDAPSLLVSRSVNAGADSLLRFIDRSGNDSLISNLPQITDDLEENFPRRTDIIEGEISGILRFRNQHLPYFKFTATRKEIDDAILIVDNPEVTKFSDQVRDSVVTSYEARAIKNTLLTQNLDLTSQVFINSRRNAVDREEFGDFNEHIKEYGTAFRLRYNAGVKVYSLSFGGSLADAKNDDSDDDAQNNTFLSFRYAAWPKPKEEKANEVKTLAQPALRANSRFRGRRSTQIEVGVTRFERDFKSDVDREVTTQEFISPFFVYEEYGLMDGYLDLLFLYRHNREKYSGRERRSSDSPLLGSVNENEFLLRPTWVPIYNLYDTHQEFRRGVENLTISFPMSARLSDGPFDRYRIGIEFFKRLVRHRISFMPEIGIDFAYYPELNRSDWGCFVKMSIGSGDPYSIKNRE